MLDLRVVAMAILACIGIVISGFHFLGFSEPNIALLGPSSGPERAIAGPPLSLPPASLRTAESAPEPAARPAQVAAPVPPPEAAREIVTGSIDRAAKQVSKPLPASIRILRVQPVEPERASAEPGPDAEPSVAVPREAAVAPQAAERKKETPKSAAPSAKAEREPAPRTAAVPPPADPTPFRPETTRPETAGTVNAAAPDPAGDAAGVVGGDETGEREGAAPPAARRTVRPAPKPKDDADQPNKVLLFLSKYGDPARNKLPAE